MNIQLLQNADAIGVGASVIANYCQQASLPASSATLHATGSVSAGTGSATIAVEVSNDDTNWLHAGNITLTLGASITGDGFPLLAPWQFLRGKVTSISGTGARVSLTAGV